MKKGTFVRNGNIGFTGLIKIEEPERGRTLIVCQHCGGDAVQNKEKSLFASAVKKASRIAKPREKEQVRQKKIYLIRVQSGLCKSKKTKKEKERKNVRNRKTD